MEAAQTADSLLLNRGLLPILANRFTQNKSGVRQWLKEKGRKDAQQILDSQGIS